MLKNEVPEGLFALFVERDGKVHWVLLVEVFLVDS